MAGHDKQDERNVLTIRMAKWETHLDIFSEHPCSHDGGRYTGCT